MAVKRRDRRASIVHVTRVGYLNGQGSTGLTIAVTMQPAQAGLGQGGEVATVAVPGEPDWFSRGKDIADGAASVATVIGLVIAGVWTWRLFVKQRLHYPRANVEHRVAHWRVGDQVLLRVTVRLTNVGSVLLQVKGIKAVIEQLLPLPDDVTAALAEGRDPVAAGQSEILWDNIGERTCDFTENRREVEPGEIDECTFDFVLPGAVRKIQVYSHVQNLSKSDENVGWNTSTVCDLTGVADDDEKGVDDHRSRAAETDQAAAPTEEGQMKRAADDQDSKD